MYSLNITGLRESERVALNFMETILFSFSIYKCLITNIHFPTKNISFTSNTTMTFLFLALTKKLSTRNWNKDRRLQYTMFMIVFLPLHHLRSELLPHHPLPNTRL